MQPLGGRCGGGNAMGRLAKERLLCSAVSVSFRSIRTPFPFHRLCPNRGQMLLHAGDGTQVLFSSLLSSHALPQQFASKVDSSLLKVFENPE